AVGTGIKPQSLSADEGFKADVQALWRDWTAEADAAGQTDFYG
ncbi:phage portal protein, partial [Ralstonia solanacearum]